MAVIFAGLRSAQKNIKIFILPLDNLFPLCYNTKVRKNVPAALAQPDRVPGYEPVGRGFESLMPRHNKRTALVAVLLLCHSMGGFEAPSVTQSVTEWGAAYIITHRCVSVFALILITHRRGGAGMQQGR